MKHDARDARPARQLPDAVMWEIVCNPSVPAPQIADALGANAGTIRNVRYRFRREGWSCRVAFVPCAMCNEPVTVGGHVRRDRVYHPTCKPTAIKAIQRGIDRRRWERTDVHERNRLLDKARDHDQTYQAATSQTATHAWTRWTVEEEAVLIEFEGERAYTIAERLGRTLYAVRGRQVSLRRRGLL